MSQLTQPTSLDSPFIYLCFYFWRHGISVQLPTCPFFVVPMLLSMKYSYWNISNLNVFLDHNLAHHYMKWDILDIAYWTTYQRAKDMSKRFWQRYRMLMTSIKHDTTGIMREKILTFIMLWNYLEKFIWIRFHLCSLPSCSSKCFCKTLFSELYYLLNYFSFCCNSTIL